MENLVVVSKIENIQNEIIEPIAILLTPVFNSDFLTLSNT